LEYFLVQEEQASSRISGIPFGAVEVRAELASPAIKIWGFLKVGETLRVFLYVKY